MVAFAAQAVNTAANFILEKMALNDWETLVELKQEILSCITNAGISKNNAQSEPSYKNHEGSGETAHIKRNYPEPMEAQETKITTHLVDGGVFAIAFCTEYCYTGQKGVLQAEFDIIRDFSRHPGSCNALKRC